jgi:hypothetical protein
MELRDVFTSAEWFGKRNTESLLLFLFHGTEFRVVFTSAEGFGIEFREFASIFVPQNGIPSCFLFTEGFGTEFRVVFSSTEGFGTDGIPKVFFFRRTAGIPSVITICSAYSRIIFLSEVPNPLFWDI